MARPAAFDKEEVLDKAMKLFWRQGYHHTSAQDMVEHIGLSRSSIYNSFSDKRSLFEEALRHYIGQQSESLLNMLRNSKPHPDSIRKLLELVVESSLDQTMPQGCFAVNSATELGHADEQVRQIIEDNIRNVVSTFREFIEAAQRQHTINPAHNASALATALFHNMTGIRVSSKVIKDRTFHQQNIDAMMQLFKP